MARISEKKESIDDGNWNLKNLTKSYEKGKISARAFFGTALEPGV